MPTFKFSKLVRDNIAEQQIASGAKPSLRILSPAEHKRELINKLIEEAQEIAQAADHEVAAEIADVQQALDDLKELCKVTDRQVALAQQKKQEKNGAFKQAIFIDHVTVDENDEWVKYYHNHADRYPEIPNPESN